MLTIFDRFFRTAADTSHAVGTLIVPDWLSIFHMDIVQRTHIHAFAAGNTFAGNVEFLRMHE